LVDRKTATIFHSGMRRWRCFRKEFPHSEIYKQQGFS
jgi:hypothetical protein